MKVSASKKTIVILSVCFVLLLLGGLSLLYKDVIHNGLHYGKWFMLDKHHGELIDCAEYKEGEKEIHAKCQGFLVGTSEQDTSNIKKNICKEFYIVYKDYQGWQRFNPCLKKENFTFNNILTKDGYYMPVNINIKYEKRFPFIYSLSSIEVEEMSDEELFQNILPKNEPIKLIASKGNLAIQEHLLSERDRYFVVEEYDYPHITYFEKFQLKEIKLVDNKIMLLLTGTIKDKSITLEIYSTNFLFGYYNNSKNLEDVLINAENYKTIKINSLYRIYFLSLSNKEDEKLDDILSYCKKDLDDQEISKKIFCRAGEEKIKNSIITNRHSYIDSLLREAKDSQHIKPEKFILYLIDNLD